MKRNFSDMMGRTVELSHPPKRIVSIVPSQTELLYDLGLDEEVIGITKFCIHPEAWFRNKTRVGGTKQLHIDKIKALQPDLIIANKEENEKEQVEELAKFFPVWTSDIKTVDDALVMIRSVGDLIGKGEEADILAKRIEVGFSSLKRSKSNSRVAYFIWYKPWMSIGQDTFINSILEHLGWKNVLEGLVRYPEITLQELKELQPELVILSSEPFPFKEKHVAEIKEVLPGAEVMLADGEMFSWYGSRMLLALPYFNTLLSAE